MTRAEEFEALEREADEKWPERKIAQGRIDALMTGELRDIAPWAERDERDYMLAQIVKSWETIPPSDARWMAGYILLGLDEFYKDPLLMVDMRDAVVDLLQAIDRAGGDLAEAERPELGIQAKTAAELRWATRRIERGVTALEDASYAAFAATRGVTMGGAS